MRLSIVGVAKGGAGIARACIRGQSRTVLVPYAAPGDVVDAEVTIVSGTPWGRVIEIMEASADRVKPACPYVQACGGCDLMHLSLEAQHHAREQIVRSALRHILTDATDFRFHCAPYAEKYRVRTRVAVEETDVGLRVGYRAARSHEIVEVEHCLVLEPAIDRARAAISEALVGARGRGEVSIYRGTAGRPAVSLNWDGVLSQAVYAQLTAKVEAAIWSGVEIAIDGCDAFGIGDARGEIQAFDGTALFASAGGFMQAFEAMNRLLVQIVVERAKCEGTRCLELFAGAGNITVALAPLAAHLETSEADKHAVDAARANLLSRGLRATLRCEDANSARIHPETRVIVLDPPRTGAHVIAERLSSSRAHRIVMVSCDPSTLARDLSQICTSGTFWLSRVDVLEMFPHTSHLETVALLERRR